MFINCATVGKLLQLSVLQFLHLPNGDNNRINLPRTAGRIKCVDMSIVLGIARGR